MDTKGSSTTGAKGDSDVGEKGSVKGDASLNTNGVLAISAVDAILVAEMVKKVGCVSASAKTAC